MSKSLAALTTLLLCATLLSVEGGHRNASSHSTQRNLRIQVRSCALPENAQSTWHYHSLDGGRFKCLGVTPNEFAMLRSYVHGGKEKVHWKYTNNEDDPDCMKNWTYYDKDALTVKGFFTSLALSPGISPKSWCAMNVYRVGGLKGKQWESCECAKQTPTTAPSPTGLVPWTYGCSVSRKTIANWHYNKRKNGPYNCTMKHDKTGKKWTMLNAYRSFGTKGVHWKYTDNPNDPQCLSNWRYYEADGVTKIADIEGKITMARETKSWCALPVYRSGGKEGYQWSYCICP